MPHLPLSPSQSIEAALREVSETDPNVLQAIELVGFPPTRNRPPGFATLLRIIMGQQVSTASAEAINSRLETANLFDPVASALASDETLRSVGLSSAKARYARALAEAVTEGSLSLDELTELDSAEAIKRLTRIPGIGQWTAEIYCMFALNAPDIFPAGDLALREGVRLLDHITDRPSVKETIEITKRFAPHRSAVALLVWQLYRHHRKTNVFKAL